jgi:F-type H+-transporting ATPase subunit b
MNINLTLFGQMLSFAVFVWFAMKFVWPPIIKSLEERKAKIADGLAAAERGHHEKELAQKRATEAMHEAKAHAAEIVGMAQKRAAEIVDEAKTTARSEGERILIAAHAEIEQETNRVKEQLREQVAELAIAAAEKILTKEIDAAKHRDILDTVVKQI